MMLRSVRRVLRNEKAATAVEYALITALLSLAVVAAMTGMGQSMKAFFNFASDKATAAAASVSGT